MRPSSPFAFCPSCRSRNTKRFGVLNLRHETVQRFMCQSCRKTFSDRETRYKSYPLKAILRAISLYNLGRTIAQTRKEMARRFHIIIPETTIHSWIKSYSHVCTFGRLRNNAIKLCRPKEMIFSKEFEHSQIYRYRLHRAKLDLLSKEIPENKFRMLKIYLEKIPTNGFPHHIFQPKAGMEELSRSSRMRFHAVDSASLKKQNLANTLASLGLHLAKNSRERHDSIEDFMIANDSVTVACEVPVYLTAHDISYFRSKGFTLNFGQQGTPITGHIDILQIRNGMMHILDYKPEAEKVNAVNQLTMYALALASRTKLAVKDFKCAWFDEKNYYEFFPLHAVYSNRKI